jgi:hypothetical protein
MDAALSLKVSSSLIGACRMEHICGTLNHALARGDQSAPLHAGQEAQDHLPELAAAVAAILDEAA